MTFHREEATPGSPLRGDIGSIPGKHDSHYDVRTAELVWPGKSTAVTTVALPFQCVEQIDEPRAEQFRPPRDLFSLDRSTRRQSNGWRNKLIWGDNKLALSSLIRGPQRLEIEEAGGLKLVYIDPPFDVGADFSFDIDIGDGDRLRKEPSVIEEVAYRDTWGRGVDSYISMMYERLSLIHELLAPDGSIFVHCDWRVSPYMRLILDEIFSKDNFRNEIYWYYYNKMPDTRKGVFPRATDTIFWYVKDRDSGYFFEPLLEKRDTPVKQLVRKKVAGRMVNARDDQGNVMYSQREDRVVDNVWRLSMLQPADVTENLRYATQKPEHLLERILKACSKEGDLVADFFCGSGTMLAVAEKMGRKWIGCDLGRFAVHVSRKRLISVQRQLKDQAKEYRAFEVLNLGKYERQFFVGIDPTLPEDARQRLSLEKEENYVSLILEGYRASRIMQCAPFHGRKGNALVLVGPVDAPVTLAQVTEAIDVAARINGTHVDCLGFEFEMGLAPFILDEARRRGIELALRYIPKDVFDRRAVEKGQVNFYDVAYVEATADLEHRSVTVSLVDFGVFYRQGEVERITAELKTGSSRITVDNGNIVRLLKTKDGDIETQVLTSRWSDWIDYWAVDFDFGRRREILQIKRPDGDVEDVWSGNYLFENQWQSFRTRADRRLQLTSERHEYSDPGTYRIAVKVIDIFGNDTTKVLEVTA